MKKLFERFEQLPKPIKAAIYNLVAGLAGVAISWLSTQEFNPVVSVFASTSIAILQYIVVKSIAASEE